MRLPAFPLAFVLATLSSIALAKDHTVSVYTWPFDEKTPTQLASIAYNSETLATTVTGYSPPSIAPTSGDQDVRVGLWDAKSSTWRGVLTTLASFDASNQAKLVLHVDENGEAWHLGISSYSRPKPKKSKKKKKKRAEDDKPKKKKKPKKGKQEEQISDDPLLVEIVKPVQGPSPVLNKPVVLDPDGKLPEKDQEKTFLQKYWWAIALFIAVQVLLPTGDSK